MTKNVRKIKSRIHAQSAIIYKLRCSVRARKKIIVNSKRNGFLKRKQKLEDLNFELIKIRISIGVPYHMVQGKCKEEGKRIT